MKHINKILKINEFHSLDNILVGELSTINRITDTIFPFDKYRIILRDSDIGIPHFHIIIIDRLLDIKVSIEKMDIINSIFTWDDFPNEYKLLMEWLDKPSANGDNLTNYKNILLMWDVAHGTDSYFDNEWM